jgi:hypothetical protein
MMTSLLDWNVAADRLTILLTDLFLVYQKQWACQDSEAEDSNRQLLPSQNSGGVVLTRTISARRERGAIRPT